MVSLFSVCFFCRASQLGPSHRIRPKPRTSHRIASASQRIVFPRIIVNRLGSLPRSARPLSRTQRRRGGATAPWNIDFACGKKGGNKRTIVQLTRNRCLRVYYTYTESMSWPSLQMEWMRGQTLPCSVLPGLAFCRTGCHDDESRTTGHRAQQNMPEINNRVVIRGLEAQHKQKQERRRR